VITLILFVVQLVLHFVFIVPVLDDIGHAVLWVLLAFHYILLLAIAYDYINLTVTDPVDPLVLNEDLSNRFRVEDLSYCMICDRNVHINSHHCYRCNRCTGDFDHHCKYLNNCIGGQNYESFFRLLCVYSLYNINMVAQCIWVFIRNNNEESIAFGGNKWGVIVLLVLTVVIFLAVGGLLAFHCYITLCENTTTLAYTFPDKKSSPNPEPGRPEGNKMNINIF